MSWKGVMQVASAYVGILIGAGFASGQEILQFFTYFGWWGALGSIVAGLLFAWFGHQFLTLGSKSHSNSHKEVFHKLCGKYLGGFLEIVITFYLFGVGGIMFAGAGAVLHQQFGLSPILGSMTMVVLTIMTLFLQVEKVISVIGLFTPFLVAIVLIIAIMSYLNMDVDLASMNKFAQPENAASGNWLSSAILYASYNLAGVGAILISLGSARHTTKTMGAGGIVGGITIGLLILIIHFGMMTNLDKLEGVELPTLFLANETVPWLSPFLSIVLIAMIFNTAIGVMYSFTARIVKQTSNKFKLVMIGACALSYFSSFVGFSKLISIVYPFFGYIGFLIMAVVVIAWFRSRIQKEKTDKSLQH